MEDTRRGTVYQVHYTADDVNQPCWFISKMSAACLEQNALWNVSCRVIEFSLQYQTHEEL